MRRKSEERACRSCTPVLVDSFSVLPLHFFHQYMCGMSFVSSAINPISNTNGGLCGLNNSEFVILSLNSVLIGNVLSVLFFQLPEFLFLVSIPVPTLCTFM